MRWVLQRGDVGFAGVQIARHMRDRGHAEHLPILCRRDAGAPGVSRDGLGLAPQHVLPGGDQHRRLAGGAARTRDEETLRLQLLDRSEEHTSELQSLMSISYA